MRARSTRFAFLFAIVLLAFASSTASAATTIGSDLSHAPNFLSCAGKAPAVNVCSFANASLTVPAAGGLTAPADGVLVRWRVRASGSPTTTFLMATLHVLSGNTSKLAAPSVSLPFADTITVHESRLPLSAGDRLGLTLAGIASDPFVVGIAQYGSSSPSPGSTDGFPLPLTEGAAQTPSSMTNVETLVNADIEADADHDGFGDETQDLCPGSALSQSVCVPATITSVRFKRGQGFSLKLSQASTLDVLIEKVTPGRLSKNGKCAARARKGKRCKLFKRVKSISNIAAASGTTMVPFAPKRLAAGSYRATINAKTSLGQTSTAEIAFKVT